MQLQLPNLNRSHFIFNGKIIDRNKVVFEMSALYHSGYHNLIVSVIIILYYDMRKEDYLIFRAYKLQWKGEIA